MQLFRIPFTNRAVHWDSTDRRWFPLVVALSNQFIRRWVEEARRTAEDRYAAQKAELSRQLAERAKAMSEGLRRAR